MNLNDVKVRVEKIRELRRDADSAHEMEDDLYTDLIREIARGGDEVYAEMAKAALKTQEIDFVRECT